MTAIPNRIAVGVGTAVSVLVVVLALVFDWATWVWLPLAAVLGPATAIVLRSVLLDRDDEPAPHPQRATPAAPQPPPPPAPRREAVSGLPLPTKDRDYRFLFSATVSWLHDPHVPAMTADLAAMAKQNVIARAVDRARQYGPDEHAVATVDLGAILSERITVANGHYVWATDVTLTLSDADARRLERIAELRKQRALWELERAHELGVRDYLGKEVLRDPGSAVTWWFARNLDKPDAIATTVRDIDNLRRLTSAAHATHVPTWDSGSGGPLTVFPAQPSPPVTPNGNDDPVRRLTAAVDELAEGHEPALRATLHRRLAELLRVHGLTAAADTLSRPDDVVEAEPGNRDDGPEDGITRPALPS
ncbi:hypothetical protein [Saccharomonospora cyanea]|uniref:Uncharacterized protein n=1 Tax=Saccharomonospora cyanea NA-134 TaxID=882082 RepID=H5XCY6_9PSEU|nr:hypothetical protein [Saccharomonospora cyanea]EHR62383.1 hypothetical protein SaccyDRAFT_3555 [Saccharomonospora cyanea NA-134]